MSKDVVALHGPDHCRGGPDPIPCLGGYPYVFRKRSTGQTIGAGVVDYMSWTSDDFDEAAGHFTAGDAISFNIIGPGVFDFVGGVVWSPSFNSVAMVQVACDAFGSFPAVFAKGGLYTGGGSLIDGGQATFIHLQARVASGTSATALIVGHENGSSQTVSKAFFRVARIGDWTGAGVGGEADFALL